MCHMLVVTKHFVLVIGLLTSKKPGKDLEVSHPDGVGNFLAGVGNF